MRRREPRAEQLTFDRLLGGRRKGGGRKKSPSSGVSHLKRAEVTGKVPVHVTTRVSEDMPNLRQPKVREVCLSSGLWFTGWRDYVHDGWMGLEGPVAQARSWMLREGWKRYGLLELRIAWDPRLNPFRGLGGREIRV